MSKWQTKDYGIDVAGGTLVDVDKQTRKVKSVVAVFNNVDYDNDIIVPEAVTKTILECGPQGKNLIVNLIDHTPSLKCVLGKPSDLYVEGNKLFAVTPIVETEVGEDYIKLCEAGVINQYSIGFSTIKSTMREDVRIIQELKLWEYSAVVWGANPETYMESIKGVNLQPKENLNKRLDALLKAFKNGSFTDETFSLLEIEIKQIQSLIDSKFTQPAAKAVEPINQTLVEALKQFNKQF